jgi:preprotein translocase subunit SecD
MAIDANILIFERIKDEMKSWKNIEEATISWFKKSWSAIWDSNVTWFIVALILFIFGINMIKGFWLMLAIWIVVSLFSAMWISRILLVLLSDTMKSEKLFIWFKK